MASPDHLYYADVAKRIDANRAALSAACKFESPLPGDLRTAGSASGLGVLVRREVDGIFAMPAAPDRSVRHGSRMASGLGSPRPAQDCSNTSCWARLGSNQRSSLVSCARIVATPPGIA
jgi:hypothetical protein